MDTAHRACVVNPELRDAVVMHQVLALEGQLMLTQRKSLYGMADSVLGVFPMTKDKHPHWVTQLDEVGSSETKIEFIRLCAAFPEYILCESNGQVRTVVDWMSTWNCSIFHYSQQGLFWMLFEKFHGPYSIQREVAVKAERREETQRREPKVENVYFETYGPTSSQVTFFKDGGDVPFAPSYEVNNNGVIYRFARGQQQFVKEIPEDVRHMFWSETIPLYKGGSSVKDPAYYTKNPEKYAVETFAERVSDLMFVVQAATTRIVAPGDGAGVVLTLAEGMKKECLSTDLYPPANSKKGVQRMSILETLLQTRPTDLLVLSYVSVFLTKIEWEIIRRKKLKVFILDDRPVLRHLGHLPVYRGFRATSYGFEVKNDPRWARQVQQETLRYTENLLVLPTLYVERYDEGLLYMQSMQPYRTFLTHPDYMEYFLSVGIKLKLDKEPVLYWAFYLAEHVQNMREGKHSYYYMSGRTEGGMMELRDLMKPFNILQCRTTYLMPDVMETPAKLKTVHEDGIVYLNWPYETTMEYKYSHRSSTAQRDGILHFRTDTKPEFIVMSKKELESRVYIKLAKGTEVFSFETVTRKVVPTEEQRRVTRSTKLVYQRIRSETWPRLIEWVGDCLIPRALLEFLPVGAIDVLKVGEEDQMGSQKYLTFVTHESLSEFASERAAWALQVQEQSKKKPSGVNQMLLWDEDKRSLTVQEKSSDVVMKEET